MDKVLRHMDTVMRRLEQLHAHLAAHTYNDKDTIALIDCNERMLIALHRFYEGHAIKFRIRPKDEIAKYDVPAIEA